MGAGTVSRALYGVCQVMFVALYYPSPMYFVILCWNNLDWQIMGLLWRQLQFKVVLVFTLHIVVMYAWHAVAAEGTTLLLATFQSTLQWSPLLEIIFLDAMRRQSKLFRFALPCTYLMLVLVMYILYAYTYHPVVITTNGNDLGHAVASAGATFQGQIGLSLSSLGVLMLSFLKSAFSDTSGKAVLFPLNVAEVMKTTVPLILEVLKGSHKMAMVLDEPVDEQVVVTDEGDVEMAIVQPVVATQLPGPWPQSACRLA
jgi:hypothetical protein